MGKKRNHFSHNANWFKCIIINVTRGASNLVPIGWARVVKVLMMLIKNAKKLMIFCHHFNPF